MSAVSLTPSEYTRHPACNWCGLRIGPHRVGDTATCTECLAVGNRGRLAAYIARLRRAARKGQP